MSLFWLFIGLLANISMLLHFLDDHAWQRIRSKGEEKGGHRKEGEGRGKGKGGEKGKEVIRNASEAS